MMGIGGLGTFGSVSLLFILLLVWGLFWKGFALWYAAKRHEKWWFIAFLIINTAGILEIVYIFFIAKVPEFRKKLGL
ncbi:MAG: hypothetical protein A2854_04870 [Parcubacteria group bacterium RIFCSPHIGHO2_01_FULL_56_18]|nr:MAG: hypothetical protein A2854_04870 [Parcubacteria group bacterium RIFCSPHIGHO2_01_FULL_56_18]